MLIGVHVLLSLQGPLSLFSSANDWTGARTAAISRSEAGFGFAIRGNAPVLICSVDPGSPAEVRMCL